VLTDSIAISDTEVDMSEDQDFFKAIIDNLYDGVYFVDRDRVITYWNKGAERITGYPASQTLGRACRDNLLNHVTANGVQLCLNNCPLAAAMEDGNEREAEVFVHHADGHRVPIVIRASPIRDRNGEIIGAVESFSNNSDMMDTRGKLRALRREVTIDALTGVGNRRFLEGRLSAVIAEYQNSTGAAGLLFMDVDHFKLVNDTFGHNTGDMVLRMVAKTLRLALRTTDTVGRWGGEEFIAILYEIQDEDGLRAAAEKVRTLVECSRLDLKEKRLAVTISIGGTLLQPGDTPEQLVQRADELMYQSKQAGRNRVTIG
jgi:diguanylate cyclase (GGDEF)-like protein/PAS domain S-box-containing protein